MRFHYISQKIIFMEKLRKVCNYRIYFRYELFDIQLLSETIFAEKRKSKMQLSDVGLKKLILFHQRLSYSEKIILYHFMLLSQKALFD